jgi:selenocysteine lyase/cysteine desulfurase
VPISLHFDYADDRCGIVSFNIAGQSPLLVAFYLDMDGITVRAGTHCAQPLLNYMGTAATCRVSLLPEYAPRFLVLMPFS